ncbi:Cytoplasmic protein, partial [Monkeypox virus]
PR